jgi:hypothetical protein
MPRLLAAACAAVLALPASVAQPAHFQTVCTLYDHDGEAVSGPLQEIQLSEAAPAGEAQRVVTVGATATFEVDYSGFSAQARTAFQRAVDIWADHLTSPVPIRVQASFAPLASGTLGSAGPNVTANFPNRPLGNTWYPFALADALAGEDLSPDPGDDFFYDIIAQFSSTRSDWYFGLDGNPPPGQFDFVTIVLHELGHGLGFVGSGKVDDGAGEDECEGTSGTGCWGYFDGQFFGRPFVFDRFLDDSSGRPMVDRTVYGNPSNSLGFLLQGGALFMDSPEVVRLYGAPAPVWAPTPFNEGSSFSHWDEEVVTGTSAALMTPQVARGEAYQDPGDITCAFMADIGWPLGSGCQVLTVADEPEPAASAFRVDLAGPNPFRTSTAVRVVRPAAGPLRVVVLDVLGREVARLADGPEAAEVTVAFVPTGLASGVYRIVAESDGRRAAQSVTVVR